MANGAEEPPISIVFLDKQSYSHVTFTNVKKGYTPGIDIKCQYSLSKHITHRPKDWLGIFKVGWTTPRDYFTFVWAPPSTIGEQEVLFAAYYLPKDEEEYYQFCYVDQDGSVRGASSPFRFHRETEDDMVVVPSPGELESLQEKNNKIQKENEALKEKCELLMTENKNVQDLLKQSQAIVKELEEQKVGLQNQNVELQNQNVELQNQNAGLQSQYKSIQCQNEELQKQTAESGPAFQLTAAHLELVSAKNEIEMITRQKEELQKQVESLTDRAEKLELELKIHKDETSLIKTECNHLREQSQKVKSDKDEMENSLRKALDRISMLKSERDNLQTERDNLKTETEKIWFESEAKTKHAQNLMTEKEQTILSQEKVLQDLEDQLRKERQNIDKLQQNMQRHMSLQEDPTVNPRRIPPLSSFEEVDWQSPENSGLVYGNPYGSVPGNPSAVAKMTVCPYCEREFEEDMCDAHIQLEHILTCHICSATYSVLEKQVYEDHVFCHTVEDDF